jgi:hypothetical protein
MRKYRTRKIRGGVKSVSSDAPPPPPGTPPASKSGSDFSEDGIQIGQEIPWPRIIKTLPPASDEQKKRAQNWTPKRWKKQKPTQKQIEALAKLKQMYANNDDYEDEYKNEEEFNNRFEEFDFERKMGKGTRQNKRRNKRSKKRKHRNRVKDI